MPTLTESENGFTLTQHNCALCKVAKQYPELCKSELKLFSELLGPEVKVERVNHILMGDQNCSFSITKGLVISGNESRRSDLRFFLTDPNKFVE